VNKSGVSPRNDISKIEIKGNGLFEAKMNQETEFIIDGSRVDDLYDSPDVRLTGNKQDIDVKITKLGLKMYRCSYVPLFVGNKLD
jgi:hypothetical protein